MKTITEPVRFAVVKKAISNRQLTLAGDNLSGRHRLTSTADLTWS